MTLLNDIPEYLHQSELYRSLEDQNDDEIDFQFLKPDISINNIQDWIHLFKTCNYFEVDHFPETLLNYYLEHPVDINFTLDNIYGKNDPLVLLTKELIKPNMIKRIQEYWTEFQFSCIN